MSVADDPALVAWIEDVLHRRLGFVPRPLPRRVLTAFHRLAATEGVTSARLLGRQRLAPEPQTLEALIAAATVPHTRFNRHQEQLDRFASEVAQRKGELTIWSAGCATGEEPYTLAMILLEQGARGRILATDISAEALERARAATYTGSVARRAGLDVQGDSWRVPREARELVRFERASLVGSSPSCGERDFDYVFCRNVLIYFDAEEGRRLVERLLGTLAAGGSLVLGPVEALRRLPSGVRRVPPLGWVRREPVADEAPAPSPATPADSPTWVEPDLDGAARALGDGDLDLAEQRLRHVLTTDPQAAVAWFLLGEVLLQRAEAAQARVAFSRAATLADDDEAGTTLAAAARRRANSDFSE